MVTHIWLKNVLAFHLNFSIWIHSLFIFLADFYKLYSYLFCIGCVVQECTVVRMSSYPEDYYYSGSERVFCTSRDTLSSTGYDRFSSYSLAPSSQYVHHLPSSYSSTSRIVNGTGVNLRQTEKTLSGRIMPSPVMRDIHFDTYQSLPSPYKINSRTFQPPYSYAKNSWEDADQQTGDKIGFSSKSKSLYDLSSTFHEERNYGNSRHDHYEDKDDHDENIKVGIGRWNEDYIRRKQRNGALVSNMRLSFLYCCYVAMTNNNEK